jgi:hypothetical protein
MVIEAVSDKFGETLLNQAPVAFLQGLVLRLQATSDQDSPNTTSREKAQCAVG